MPSLKKSVMFSEATQEYIRARTRSDDDIAWSEALNETFKALKWVSQEALPELSTKEWEYILNVYAGSLIEFAPPFRIASDMMDDAGVVDISDLDADYRDLVKKIHGISQVEQFAIMDFVQKFWARDWSGCADFAEIADQIKAL